MHYLNHAKRVSAEKGGFRTGIPPHLAWTESITFTARADDENTYLASQSTQRTGSHSLCAL
jgi:hypothetical protein